VGIANGIVRYLNERDPNDGAALLPPEYKTQRPLAAEGVDIFALPRNSANIVAHVGPESRLFVFQERDGWYQVVVRGGGRITGWVRRELLAETNDPLPTPPPATDS
jgi:N-acetylmuramoyl-L-alanine amidase